MTLSFFTLLIVVAIIIIIADFFIYKGTELNWDSIKGILFVVVFASVVITELIAWVLPDVTVITKTGNGFDHDNEIVVGSYKGKSLSFFDSYISNESDKELVLYPIIYSTDEKVTQDVEVPKEKYIKPKSIEAIENKPDYYFETPPKEINESTSWYASIWNLITGNGRNETKWVLDQNKISEAKQLIEKMNAATDEKTGQALFETLNQWMKNGKLHKMSRDNDPFADYLIATVYAMNHNRDSAFFYIKKSADLGYVDAQNELGQAFESGSLEGQPNYNEAYRYYKMAADQGDAVGINNVGWCYENGYGVAKNLEEARKLYEKAYKLGDWHGAGNLSSIYMSGKGVPADPSKALPYMKFAAEAGEPHSCYNLGIFYFTGQYVEKDVDKANRLIKTAANAGHPEAIELLKHANGDLHNLRTNVGPSQK